VPYTQNKRPALYAGIFDIVRNGRIVGGGDGWNGVVDCLGMLDPGVYDVTTGDGTPVAVATVRLDGTWRMEGGKRYGRNPH